MKFSESEQLSITAVMRFGTVAQRENFIARVEYILTAAERNQSRGSVKHPNLEVILGRSEQKKRLMRTLKAAESLLPMVDDPIARSASALSRDERAALREMLERIVEGNRYVIREWSKGGRPSSAGLWVLAEIVSAYRQAFDMRPSSSPDGRFMRVANAIKQVSPITFPTNKTSIETVLKPPK